MIPKKIHYCWLSGDPLPLDIKKYINDWKKILPDYEIILWDSNKFEIDSVRWVKEAYETKKYAFAADYIRFYALYNYGGIYLDSDVEVLKKFDDLLNLNTFMGFEYTGIPEAAVIGAEKGSDWVKDCLDWYKDKSFYGSDGKMRQVVVPFLIQKVVEEKYNTILSDKGKIIDFTDNIKIFPYKYFSPKNFYSGKIRRYPETYTIHHSMASWVKEGLKTKFLRIFHIILITVFGKSFHDELNRIIHKIKLYKRCRIDSETF